MKPKPKPQPTIHIEAQTEGSFKWALIELACYLVVFAALLVAVVIDK